MKKILENMLNDIPEQYVYISGKNNEYTFSSGNWFSKSGTKVENHKKQKVTESAKQQIKKTNQNSVLKIGQQYMVNESTYTYVGNNKFTSNGQLLTETDSIGISNFLHEDESVLIPDYFIYTAKSGNRFMKKGDSWINLQTKKPVNNSNVNAIIQASERFIKEFNNSNPVKIGTKYTSNKNKDYFFNGTAFVSSEGKSIPANATEQILKNLSGKSQNSEEESVPEPSTNSDENTSTDTGVNTDSDSQSDDMSSLASRIKSHPKRSKLIALLARGDEVSLLAADIILDDKEQDAIKIINDLK